MVATCPDDFELESVLCRLRIGARAVFHSKASSAAWRARYPDVADYHNAFREQRDKAMAELRRVGYSDDAYQKDRLALEAALLATARTCGEIALKRIEGIADDFLHIYLSGPDANENISDLTLAIRNWLPFVSYSPYLRLYDEVTAVSEMTELEPLPEMSMKGELPSDPDPPPAVPPGGIPSEADLLALNKRGDKGGILHALFASRYMPWRTPEKSGDPTDPRCQVMEREGETDQDLRARLYLQHPILMVMQNLSPPTELQHRMPPVELQRMLLLSVLAREQALRQVVKLCVQHLREAGKTLQRELSESDVDWSHFRPLLIWGAEIIAKGEPQQSVVLDILSDIVSELARPRWTERDSLAAAAVGVAIVMTVASFGVGGAAGFALIIADIAVQSAAVHAHELLTERENAERDRMNRGATVDAALKIASNPEVSHLGWWLGVISLVTLPVAAVGLAAGVARFLRGQKLGQAREAALAAARKASMDVKVSRFSVSPEPWVKVPRVTSETPPARGARITTETPVVPRNSRSPARRPDGKKPLEPDLFDETAYNTVEPASAKTPAADVGRYTPQPDPNPVPRRTHRSRWAEDSPDGALSLVLAELDQTIANTNARAELQRALEEGLARKLAADPYAWEALVTDWTNVGYSADDIISMSEAANRGLLRLRGVTPATAGRDQAMQRRREELLRASSARSETETASAAAQTTQTKAVQRPNTGRPSSPAEKGTKDRSVTSMNTSQAPKGWPIQRITPNNRPDVVPDRIVLEFPTGERVWRSASDDRAIVIESVLGPPTRRRHYERNGLFSRSEMSLNYLKRQMERGHSVGQGTGFESPYGIAFQPAEMNQVFMNICYEEFLRVLYQNRSPGVTYRIITSTRVHRGSNRLSEIEFKVLAELDGKARTLFTTGIRVAGKAEESVITLAEDLTHVDPEAFALLPINDLDFSIQQRLSEMFERIRARWRKR